MSTPLDYPLERWLESAIEDAFDQYERAHPDFGMECVREDRLVETLEYFFDSPRWEEFLPFYDAMKSYYHLMDRKMFTDLKIMYLRGFLDCIRLEGRFDLRALQ